MLTRASVTIVVLASPKISANPSNMKTDERSPIRVNLTENCLSSAFCVEKLRAIYIENDTSSRDTKTDIRSELAATALTPKISEVNIIRKNQNRSSDLLIKSRRRTIRLRPLSKTANLVIAMLGLDAIMLFKA